MLHRQPILSCFPDSSVKSAVRVHRRFRRRRRVHQRLHRLHRPRAFSSVPVRRLFRSFCRVVVGLHDYHVVVRRIFSSDFHEFLRLPVPPAASRRPTTLSADDDDLRRSKPSPSKASAAASDADLLDGTRRRRRRDYDDDGSSIAVHAFLVGLDA